jgi:hypothetical protein
MIACMNRLDPQDWECAQYLSTFHLLHCKPDFLFIISELLSKFTLHPSWEAEFSRVF